jgi:uncharacterized membrane protein YhaH (DUF805 family)
MSKPLFEDVFSLRGRRNRKSFLTASITFWCIGAFFLAFGGWNLSLVAGWEWSWEWRPYASVNIYNNITMISALVLMSGALLFFAQIYFVQVPQRLRDIGLSGWWVLIPLTFTVLGRVLNLSDYSEEWKFPLIINLLIFVTLVVYPGTKGENKYGPDPLLPVNFDEKNSYTVNLSVETEASTEIDENNNKNSVNGLFSGFSKRTRLVLFGCLIWIMVVPVYSFLFSPYGRYMRDDDFTHMLSVMFLPTLVVGILYWFYERFIR